MRTLFTKILVWFLLTVVVAVWGTFYVSNIVIQNRAPDYNRFRFELTEAREAWETAGRKGLTQFLAFYMDNAGGAVAILTDGAGRDLLTGRDWSREIRYSGGRPGRGPYPLPFVRIGRGQAYLVATLSLDKKYYLLNFLPDPTASEAFAFRVPPEFWWMLGVFSILCYALARRLTSPLRRMQKTIESFGRGDFSARVNARRADEFGQLGRAVDQMAERIETLVKSQRRLLQDISHELRSPLARLGVAVELARGGGDPALALNRIEREADRLNTLVGELIQVTRAEGDPDGLATEPVRLDELIRVIAADVRIEADRRQIELHLDVCEAETDGSPELLRRAIENIVRNAIRYSPDHERIEVSLRRAGSFYRITVRDFGKGVPEEALAHIFDPFYRVEKDRGRTSGGVGLGLAIAKRAVELHHGLLRASNAYPGLLVEIDLPVPAVQPERREALISSES